MSDLMPESDISAPSKEKDPLVAEETLYLCNLSVAVDKEWLCLREVNDIPVTPDPESSHEDSKDPVAVERVSLMNTAKLSIKGLIESALNYGRPLDSDYVPLQQFFVIMEHCLMHGLKAKKTFLGQNKSFWGPLELVEKLVPEAAEITASAKDLPGLKTPVGRGRAWLRLALMQKKLSDYTKALIKRKDLLSEFYDSNALMMEEEGAVIASLLLGLNVIDANLCMKGEDLDNQVGVIDFSLWLKEEACTNKSSVGDGKIAAILDQKNYVEELNRHLSSTVMNLQMKVNSLEASNTKLTEELAVANNRIITLQEEIEHFKEESSYTLELNRKVSKHGGAANGHTVSETRKQLKEETQLRLDVERELEMQIGMRQEMELAMKMMEKDICEKQDALIALRQQLDDFKLLHHELSHKSRTSASRLKEKNELIMQLEEKTNQMAVVIKQLEQRLRQAEKDRHAAEEANRLFKSEFGDKIANLQQEVEQLTKQRCQLHLELKREQDRRIRLMNSAMEGTNIPAQVKLYQQQVDKLKKELQEIEEENFKLRKVLAKKEGCFITRSSTHPEVRQSQQVTTGKEKLQTAK